MDDPNTIKRLSSTVLDLKFMKKTKEKIIRAEKEEPILYADQLSALSNSTDNIVQLGSHYDVMKYLPCRLSFGGMEPSIEKLNADKLTGLYEVVKEETKEEEEDVDVTKEEMAESSFNKNVGQKFRNNNHNKGRKRKSDELSKNLMKRKLFKHMKNNRGQNQDDQNIKQEG